MCFISETQNVVNLPSKVEKASYFPVPVKMNLKFFASAEVHLLEKFQWKIVLFLIPLHS